MRTPQLNLPALLHGAGPNMARQRPLETPTIDCSASAVGTVGRRTDQPVRQLYCLPIPTVEENEVLSRTFGNPKPTREAA
jgi:hypothetical protein